MYVSYQLNNTFGLIFIYAEFWNLKLDRKLSQTFFILVITNEIVICSLRFGLLILINNLLAGKDFKNHIKIMNASFVRDVKIYDLCGMYDLFRPALGIGSLIIP